MGGIKGEREIEGNKGETGLGGIQGERDIGRDSGGERLREIQGVREIGRDSGGRERQSDGRVQKAIVMIENSKLHFTLVQIITNIRIKTFWIYNLFACIMCAHTYMYLPSLY